MLLVFIYSKASSDALFVVLQLVCSVKATLCPYSLTWCLRADTMLCCEEDTLRRLLLPKQVFILLWKMLKLGLTYHYRRKQEIPH